MGSRSAVARFEEYFTEKYEELPVTQTQADIAWKRANSALRSLDKPRSRSRVVYKGPARAEANVVHAKNATQHRQAVDSKNTRAAEKLVDVVPANLSENVECPGGIVAPAIGSDSKGKGARAANSRSPSSPPAYGSLYPSSDGCPTPPAPLSRSREALQFARREHLSPAVPSCTDDVTTTTLPGRSGARLESWYPPRPKPRSVRSASSSIASYTSPSSFCSTEGSGSSNYSTGSQTADEEYFYIRDERNLPYKLKKYKEREAATDPSGVLRRKLGEIVQSFGNALIQQSKGWAQHAFAVHDPAFIRSNVYDLLMEFATNITLETPAEKEEVCTIRFEMSMLITRYWELIYGHFQDHFNSFRGADGPGSSDVRPGDASRHFQYEHFEGLGLVRDMLTKESAIETSLTQGNAFKQLITSMRRRLYFDEHSQTKRIEREILDILDSACQVNCTRSAHDMEPQLKTQSQPASSECMIHSDCANVSFRVLWSLLQFAESHFDGRDPRLGSVVTLSGSALFAYGTICSEYIEKTWPKSGAFVLSAFENATSRALHSKGDFYIAMTEFLELKIEFTGRESVRVDAHGLKSAIVDLAQMLSWLSAAMSVPPSYMQGSALYAKSRLKHNNLQSSPQPEWTILTKFTKLQETERTCWLPLFSSPVIAHAFPIPGRDGEVGLEMSLDLIATIAGARHAFEYESGVVMKGFSSMLVPVGRVEDRVQWHLISSGDCNTRLSYSDAVSRCEARALLDEVDLDSLRKTRAFVGWISYAETLLGKEIANYENIDYSGAEDATTLARITGATLGFQQFGLAQVDVSLGSRDGTRHFQRGGAYRNIIRSAEKSPIVLYDRGERRAWLVPASDVMLHIAQHRSFQDPFTVAQKPIKFRECMSTRETLEANASLRLTDDERYTFGDMITGIWSMLEFLLDQKVRQSQVPGKAIRGTFKEVLTGFEYKAVVEERAPFRLKQCYLHNTHGGWPTLARDIDALILLADGFGDIIVPADAKSKICRAWQRLPKDKDYLAASVRIILDLYNVAGSRLSREYLTSSKLQWHRGGSSLFEECTALDPSSCRCDRLQQIVSRPHIRTVVRPGHLEEHGAVIFGTPEVAAPVSAGPVSQPKSLYSQPNSDLQITVENDELQAEELTFSSVPSSSVSDESSLTLFSSGTSNSSMDTKPEPESASMLPRHGKGWESRDSVIGDSSKENLSSTSSTVCEYEPKGANIWQSTEGQPQTDPPSQESLAQESKLRRRPKFLLETRGSKETDCLN